MTIEESRPVSRAYRWRVPRWLVVGAGALALVIVAGAGVLKLVFTPDKLRALVVPRLEAAVGREVELAAIRLKLFPRIAVRLDELAIANGLGFSAEPALRVEALELDVRFWPLLGRQLELRRVRLLRPVIRYEVLADGTSNLQGLGPRRERASDTPAPPGAARAAGAGAGAGAGISRAALLPSMVGAQPEGQAAAAPLFVSDLALVDGTLIYSDARGGRGARMALAGRVAAERAGPDGRALDSSGHVEVTALRALVPNLGADSVSLPDLSVDFALFADLGGDSVALRKLEVVAGAVPLSGSGSLRELRGARRLELRAASGDLDVGRLFTSLPAKMRPSDLVASGTARVSIEAAGPLRGAGPPAIEGAVELGQVVAAFAGSVGLLDDGSGTISFTRDSLWTSGLTGRLTGQPFQLRLTLRNYEDPVARGHVDADVDLAALALLKSPALPLSGRAKVALDFAGPLKEPGRLSLRGPIQLAGLRYQSASLAVPTLIPSGRIQLSGAGVTTERLPIRLGQSDLTLTLHGPQLLAFALSKGKAPLPTVEFTLSSNRLDMSEIRPADTTSVGYGDLLTARLAGRRLEGRDPGAVAREKYKLPPVPPVNARGRVSIGEFLNPPTVARDVRFDVRAERGVLRLENFAGRVYGGTLSGAVALDFTSLQAPFPLSYDLQLTDGQAGEFLARWTGLGSAISGLMDFSISGTAAIDESLLPTPDALTARGRANFRDGRFQDFGLTRALAQQFRFDVGRLAPFRQLGGAYEIHGGAFLLDSWTFGSPDLEAVITGSAGLGGLLDLQLALDVPVATLQQSGLIQEAGAAGLLSRLAGSDRKIQVAVGVGGTLARPVVQVDGAALQREMQKLLQGEGQDLLRRLLKPPPGH